MLCPEVWNFTAPESTFSTQKDSPNGKNHLKTIKNFLFSHLVSVILPDTLTVPDSVIQVLNDCDFYKISNVKVSEFVDRNFINNFVNSGNLHVLSVGTRIDCDNCVAVTPKGRLILHLNKLTYQQLGLEGAPSHFHAITKDKYIVTVDLKQKNFKPGKPVYDRTRKCLEGLRFDVIVTWEPPIAAVCPSSVAKYFHDLTYPVKSCKIKHKAHTLYTVKVPTLDDSFDFVEWLGMVALQANLTDGAPDNYVTTYETPEPSQVIGQVKFMQWRGFFTANQIASFYDKLRGSRRCQWMALYVQGFSDSAVAWRGEEHHFYTNGDNSYTLVSTDDEVRSSVQKCSRKRYNNKRRGKPL